MCIPNEGTEYAELAVGDDLGHLTVTKQVRGQVGWAAELVGRTLEISKLLPSAGVKISDQPKSLTPNQNPQTKTNKHRGVKGNRQLT